MRVLGFDPGTATTGYGVVEGKGNRLTHIAHGVITTPAGQPFAVRLETIFEEATRLLAEFQPDAVGIEEIYFKQNVTTGISVAQARGVLALAAAQYGKPIGEFAPRQVKLAVTGYGKADKGQVQRMIKTLLNLDSIPRPDDAADALGIAICQIHAGNFRAAIGE
ncbi:MAG: crossover junction endodeoxyribonuclease RuvC [Candidatus Hydrogenedentes bacterium]|nr:crossover junction endodeoxyribonuclease RuvC [Candidatus Hydrogenedentota bacterium]